MSVSFLFPGQGSQYPGMLHKLPEHAAIQQTLAEATRILKQDVYALDSESSLQSTVSVQLCLFVAGVAVGRALGESAVVPDVVAGLSVGAFAAAVTCNALDFADGLLLVQKRAQLMESKFPAGFGMSAVVGLTEQKVSSLVQQAYTPDSPVFVSNINAPRQIIVAGANSGLAIVEAAALESGARKAERLNVVVPSHCPLFQYAADELRSVVVTIKFKAPTVPYVSNVRARPLRNPALIAEDLASNIAHGVRWYDSVCVMVELGTKLFIETNPGNVLSKMGTESFPEQRFAAIEEYPIPYIAHLVANFHS